MPGMMTPAEASQYLCVIARVSGAEKPSARCVGSSCVLWRWQPVMADDPAFKLAGSVVMKNGASPNAATAKVWANREEYGVPTAPYRGWCGLGGEPKA